MGVRASHCREPDRQQNRKMFDAAAEEHLFDRPDPDGMFHPWSRNKMSSRQPFTWTKPPKNLKRICLPQRSPHFVAHCRFQSGFRQSAKETEALGQLNPAVESISEVTRRRHFLGNPRQRQIYRWPRPRAPVIALVRVVQQAALRDDDLPGAPGCRSPSGGLRTLLIGRGTSRDLD